MAAFVSDVYGGRPSRQPTSTPIPDHAGDPEPMARTVPKAPGVMGNPLLLLIVILGLAFVALRVSVGFSFSAGT